jgi:hypothetical protein
VLNQLFVAAGVAIVCVGLGLTEWARSRPARVVGSRRPSPANRRSDDEAPMYERVTRLTALTGFRRSARESDDEVWSLTRRY